MTKGAVLSVVTLLAAIGCGGAGAVSASSDASPRDVKDDGNAAGSDTSLENGASPSDGALDVPEGAGDAALDVPADALADAPASTDAVVAGCPTGLPGPTLIEVQAPSGGGTAAYCVDATEVTNRQYTQFLAANYPTAAQDTWCTWNTSYTPPRGWPAVGKDDEPVVYVCWCDALAYCKWAGKHLCGKLGGGPNGYASYADAASSEWYNACSRSGARTYPYGATFDGSACSGNAASGGSGAAGVAGSRANCEGGFPGLLDLSGNVAEWEDACNGSTGVNDACRIRGGSFLSDAVGLRCDSSDTINRDNASTNVGFRCCAAR